MTPETSSQTSVDVKLDYIQRDVREIRDAMKENVSRREFTEALKAIREGFTLSIQELKDKIDFQGKIIYGFIGLIVISVMVAIFKLVIK